MKKYFCLFLLFFFFSCFSKKDSINSVHVFLDISEQSLRKELINNVHVYKISFELFNRSKDYRIKSIVLKANVYNKASQLIASKLFPVRLDNIFKDENLNKKKNRFFSLEEMPRRKLKRLNALMPLEKKLYSVNFYDDDFIASNALDKNPVTYSVVIHKGLVIE